MREIKFRAWDKAIPHGAQMHEWDYLRTWAPKFWDGLVLMQSVGIADKNGVEIFEGDIVKTTSDLLEDVYTYRVVIDRGHTYLVTLDEDEAKIMLMPTGNLDRNIYVVVIGNIYENPELLQGDTNEL